MTRRARKKVEGIIYAKLDTKLISHPKMLAACAEDPLALDLYVRALLWSKQNETDGRIPFPALGILGFSGDVPVDTANVLVDVGLFRAFDDGFGINDYDLYQQTKRDRDQLSKDRRRAANTRWKRDRGTKHRAMQVHSKVQSKLPAETETETETELNPKNHRRASSTWPTIWSAYTARHPATKPTEKRRRLLAAREREGYDEQTLLAAIEGNHADPWCSGDNPGGKTYHSFELIFRDAAHVEQYAAIAQNGNGRESRLDRALRRAAEREGATA